MLANNMPLITHFTLISISTDEAGNAVRMTSSKFKPTLTFLRNADFDKHRLDINMDVKKKEKEEETVESDLDVEKLGVTNANVKSFSTISPSICEQLPRPSRRGQQRREGA